LFEPVGSASASKRRSRFSEIDIVLQFFSTVEAQGANDRFQVRNGDGAMTEMGAKRTLTARSSNFRSWRKCDISGCPLYGCSWNRAGRPTNAICINEYAA
jgi:hypothetical protein